MKKIKPVFLVVDLGAESGRVMSVSLDIGKLSIKEVHRFPNEPLRKKGSLRWNTDELWRNIKLGLSRGAEEFGNRIRSIGIDTWGVDFGLFGSDDTLLENPYHYRDARTDNIMDRVFELVPRSEVFQSTGIQFMQFNTLYQLYSMVWSNSPVLQNARTLLTMPDLFNFWLTGIKVSEFTIATTTQCFNPIADKWADEILDKLEIPRKIFANIVSPGTIIGNLLPSVANEVGLNEIPVVAPAAHDTGSAIAAVPLSDKNSIYLSSGTWSLMGIEVDNPVINEKALLYNFTNEGGVENTFRLLKNITGLWLVQECRRIWAITGEGDYSYPELSEMAAASEAFGAIIDPADSRFLAPENMPETIRQFCRDTDQPFPGSKGEVVRCILESLALEYRWVAERLEELSDRQLNKIHIIGGGSYNRLLNQLAADATGRIVETGVVEATTIGNALVQAKAMGNLDSISEGREIVRQSFEREIYKPRSLPDWDTAYERYLTIRKN